MISRGFCDFVGTAGGENCFAQEIEEHLVEGFETIFVFVIISEQNVLLEKEKIVPPAFDEGDAVGQHLIGTLLLVSKKGLAPATQVVFLELDKNLIDVLGHLAKDVTSIALQIRQARLHKVGLFGALEIFASTAYPLLGFQEQTGKLRCNFLGEEFQQGQPE